MKYKQSKSLHTSNCLSFGIDANVVIIFEYRYNNKLFFLLTTHSPMFKRKNSGIRIKTEFKRIPLHQQN